MISGLFIYRDEATVPLTGEIPHRNPCLTDQIQFLQLCLGKCTNLTGRVETLLLIAASGVIVHRLLTLSGSLQHISVLFVDQVLLGILQKLPEPRCRFSHILTGLKFAHFADLLKAALHVLEFR